MHNSTPSSFPNLILNYTSFYKTIYAFKHAYIIITFDKHIKIPQFRLFLSKCDQIIESFWRVLLCFTFWHLTCADALVTVKLFVLSVNIKSFFLFSLHQIESQGGGMEGGPAGFQ